MSMFNEYDNDNGTEQSQSPYTQSQSTYTSPAQQDVQSAQQNAQQNPLVYPAAQSYQYTHQQAQNGSYGGQQPPQREKKKGIAGIVVACTLSAALLGGTIGGIGGVAVGYGLAPKAQVQTQQQAGTIEQQAAAGPSAVPVATNASAMTIAEIAAKVSPSVVAIDATVTTQQMTPFGPLQSEGQGSGSGVIISKDGYIVTNNHVVDGAKTITVYLQDGTQYEAKLVGRDSKTDIAILKVEADNLPAAEIGASGALKVGDIAIAIGNPLGELAGSVTQGIISATEREITIEDETMNLLQFDAAINPGNSGGALVNGNGQVVGIVNAKSSAIGVEGIGFAIPIDDVKDVIDDIVVNGYVTGRPKMGLGTVTVTEEVSKAYNLPIGAYVQNIENFSAAEKAGLKIGDVITSLGGEEVKSNDDLIAIRDKHAPGDTLDMVIVRDGQEMTLQLTLMEDIQMVDN